MPEKVPPIKSQQAQIVRMQKIKAMLTKMTQIRMQQVSAKRLFRHWCESGFNPTQIARRFKNLEELAKKKERKEIEKKEERKVEEKKELNETASRFQRDNPDLRKNSLLALKASISSEDTVEAILKRLLEFYPDYTLADEALDFLIQTTQEEILLSKLLQVKDILNTNYQREIVAGRNIKAQAYKFSQEGLGSATALRDLYRDVTGNPRKPNVLFDDLFRSFPYDKMKTVIDFLLHSLGDDLKSKGPSVGRAELQRLLEDTRTLQAILGVYRFFGSRMALIVSQFEHYRLMLPVILTFETLAKQFMLLVDEPYPSPDKILRLAKKLGISEDEMAQIIIFTQMRDGLRYTSPRLYRSEKQRQNLLLTMIDTLESLEEEEEE